MYEAMCNAERSKTTLSRQIGLASRRGQAKIEEMVHTLLEESEFRLCSRVSGRSVGTGEAWGAMTRRSGQKYLCQFLLNLCS